MDPVVGKMRWPLRPLAITVTPKPWPEARGLETAFPRVDGTPLAPHPSSAKSALCDAAIGCGMRLELVFLPASPLLQGLV